MKIINPLRAAYVALFSLALCFGAQKAAAHGVQVGYGTTPTGFVRVYIKHWHGALSPSSLGPSDNINVTVTTASGASTFNVNASGTVNNTQAASLPGLVGPITMLVTGPSAGSYDDWGYWDFAPGSCNQPISIRINGGNSVIFTEETAAIYPQTIAAQTFTDQGAPVITANNVSVVGDCTGATVNYAVSVVDDCDASPSITYSKASGSFFPVGTTPVTVTATDNTGKTSVKVFNVVVIVGDSTPPSLTIPASISVNAPVGQCGANVTFATSATDHCSTATVVSTPASGSFFPVGTTTVTTVATDGSNNKTTKTFTVTVRDVEQPTITGPANLALNAGAGCTAIANFAATAADNCSGVAVSYSKNPGTAFALGTTVVTATATDASGNTASTTFNVVVTDATAPVITAPALAKTVECNGSNAALSAWLASSGGAAASDTCSAVIWTNNYTGLAGGCGATGSAIVTFTATDASGNNATTIATFTVVDTPAPVIGAAAANVTIESSAGNAAAISAWLAQNGGATATDACSTVTWSNNYSALTAACGTTGTATVTFTATDACGNRATTTATVTIVDTTAPAITTAAAAKSVESVGAGNTAALSAWLASNGGASATDIGSAVTWSNNFTAITAACGSTGAATVTFTATDACGNKSTTAATFTIIDTTKPTLASNVRDISPNIKPDVFTLSSTDIGGGATPSIVKVTATRVNPQGKVQDFTNSYQHTVVGNKLTILITGGVGTIWTIYGSSVDACGNTTTATYVVNVVNPTLTK